MRLTDEQKAAVRCDDEDVMVDACPGSGKTRVITSKLARAIDEVRGAPRSVACITYTNAAVYEIEARVRQHIRPGDDASFEVCTIHSFCLNFIFRPFCHLIEGYEDGFTVLTAESDEFEPLVSGVCARYGRFDLGYQDLEDFTQLRVSLEGEPVGSAIDRGGLTREIALDYWSRCRERGVVDFANIVYFSLVLLRDHPEIISYVSAKFAWLLVDEFQDTTDLQVEILTLIANAGRTRFLLIGDSRQSIFGFAGARPDLADDFASRIGARTDLRLTGNFRSSAPIVANANRLFARVPPMEAVGPARGFVDEPHVEHGASAFEVITDHFLPALDDLEIELGEAAILAPTWFTLFPLGRRLREYGVSIVGPGARPYRRNRQFAPLAEQVCGYLMEPRPESISAIERSLFNVVLDTTGRAEFDIFSYAGRVVVFRLLGLARELHEEHMGAIVWLEQASQGFSGVLREAELIGPAEEGMFPMSVEEMKADMRRNRVDLANLTIEDLGIYASPEAALKLSTLHMAKGREYDAVAMIDLREGGLPSYHDRTDDAIEEAKRRFYVGVTRARRYLLYVTDDSGRRPSVPSRFLGDVLVA